MIKKTRLLCSASPFVIAAYYYVRLIPQGSHALHPVGLADLKKRLPSEAGPGIFNHPVSGCLS
jgi:hypothetical protein